jgi:hypothetical protein
MRANCARRPDLSFAFVPQLLVLIRLVWVQQGPPPRPPSPQPDTPSAPARPHRTKWEYSTRSDRRQASRCRTPGAAHRVWLRQLRRRRAARLGAGMLRCHICPGTGLIPAASATGLSSRLTTSAPGLGSSLPHLHRNWAHPCHICTGTGSGRVPHRAQASPHLQMRLCEARWAVRAWRYGRRGRQTSRTSKA